MIHEIAPHIFNNTYADKSASPHDFVLAYKENALLMAAGRDELILPRVADLPLGADEALKFLFSIDDADYYLAGREPEANKRWQYRPSQEYRFLLPLHTAFACAVGEQLGRWYRGHKYCGCCGEALSKHPRERALICTGCGLIVYPTIMPVVIIAVTDGNKLLLSRSLNSPIKRMGLLAGFAEIGESLEETVRREVREEVGVEVKNICYYKSQPWPFTDTLLSGFFCQLDGPGELHVQREELECAGWFKREDIPENPVRISLTSEMIELFRNGQV